MRSGGLSATPALHRTPGVWLATPPANPYSWVLWHLPAPGHCHGQNHCLEQLSSTTHDVVTGTTHAALLITPRPEPAVRPHAARRPCSTQQDLPGRTPSTLQPFGFALMPRCWMPITVLGTGSSGKVYRSQLLPLQTAAKLAARPVFLLRACLQSINKTNTPPPDS